MDPEMQKRLDAQDLKLEAIYRTSLKVQRYFFWTLVAGVVTFVLPLIVLMFVLPFYISTITSSMGGLGL
jgi:hypothetical protein